ncbi:MAG: hypothetical protein D6755_09340 [Anaerolineae bacterium]|nr:MAG: hypothetical protein D6755_09340 [Anaerolineae bacterium]
MGQGMEGGCQVSGVRCQVSGVRYQASGGRYQVVEMHAIVPFWGGMEQAEGGRGARKIGCQ